MCLLISDLAIACRNLLSDENLFTCLRAYNNVNNVNKYDTHLRANIYVHRALCVYFTHIFGETRLSPSQKMISSLGRRAVVLAHYGKTIFASRHERTSHKLGELE